MAQRSLLRMETVVELLGLPASGRSLETAAPSTGSGEYFALLYNVEECVKLTCIRSGSTADYCRNAQPAFGNTSVGQVSVVSPIMSTDPVCSRRHASCEFDDVPE
jgi:hypothetical protein